MTEKALVVASVSYLTLAFGLLGVAAFFLMLAHIHITCTHTVQAHASDSGRCASCCSNQVGSGVAYV